METNADKWDEWKQRADQWLERINIQRQVDEVALLFRSRAMKFEYVTMAVQEPHTTLFNSSKDHVKTKPFNTEYDVEYHFLRMEGRGMRVEAMSLEGGLSPLHAALLECNRGTAVVPVHLSFKCFTWDDWYDTLYALDEQSEGKASLVQSCVSDYGVFAYYNVPEVLGDIYLKPRLNVRDLEKRDAEKQAAREEAIGTIKSNREVFGDRIEGIG